MKKSKAYYRTILVICGLAALLTSGCATKTENPMVTSAREAFTGVQGDPSVNKYAPLQLQEAKAAIEKVDKSLKAGGKQAEVEHLAYMAKQKALFASEVAAMKIADKELESASAERNKVLLVARSKEADYSQNQAVMARQESEAQRLAAEKERLTAEEHRRAAEKAQIEAQQRLAEAEVARQAAAAAEARAKKLEAQVADLQASQTERGLVLTLGDVLFDTGKSDLKPGANATIENLGKFLKEYPKRKVQIEGFTDSTGSDDFNFGLSVRRAEAVRNALNGQGIGLERIQYRGYGEAYPVASNDTPDGRQRNRRVEIIISDESGVITERSR